MGCDLCGREEWLCEAIVEGSRMYVCERCKKFGKILSAPVQQIKPTMKPKKEEVLFDVVEDFAKKIRDARELEGLTQKEFAKKLNEKETVMSKVENGDIKPSIPLAQKLERLLKIKLVSEAREERVVSEKKRPAMLTIGDIIEQKK